MGRLALVIVVTMLFCGGALAQCNSAQQLANCVETDQIDQGSSDGGGDNGLPGYAEFRDRPDSDDAPTVDDPDQGLYDVQGTTMCSVDGNCD